MDREIRKAKKVIDKKMVGLEKMDKKREKKCSEYIDKRVFNTNMLNKKK